MPPKKQEEQSTTPLIVWNVLPIVLNSSLTLETLKKSVNIKKNLESAKVIELLKEKGVEKYLTEGKLSREGELFLCQNLQQVSQEYMVQMKKPVDVKKEQKKESKKDSKKEEVPVEQEKVIQFQFAKAVTDFLFVLDLPLDEETVEIAVKGGFKIDVIVWVEEKIKQSSRLPDYTLLNRERTIDDFISEINSSAPLNTEQSKQTLSRKEKEQQKRIVRKVKDLRMKQESGQLQNTFIIEVPFLKDLQHPENDGFQFLKLLFERLCELSLNRGKYETWKRQQVVSSMVPTIKQKVRREVVVQQKKEEKKGAKKEVPAQVQTEIIEEIVQKKYQSLPENAKSDLKVYRTIAEKRKKTGGNLYLNILQNLAYSVSSQTEKESQVSKVDYPALGSELWRKSKAKPISQILVSNLQDNLRKQIHSKTSDGLLFPSRFETKQSISQINLHDLQKHAPYNVSLEMEYKMMQFTNMMKEMQKHAQWTFSGRKYVQLLESKVLNSEINFELEYEPKIYSLDYKQDGYKLLILARVNPPGRVLYRNFCFDWKVLPNFQFWNRHFQSNEGQAELFDYNWRKCGNLRIISKKMMPTDNMIITESVFSTGDEERSLVTLTKEDVNYGLRKTANSTFLFWKAYHNLTLYAFISEGQKQQQPEARLNIGNRVDVCIRRDDFTVLFGEVTTVFWSRHKLQIKRVFTARGEIMRYLKDGSVQIYYLNGDVSTFAYGEWTHLRNQEFRNSQNEITARVKVTTRIQGEKTIRVREDSTVFVDYLNGDRMICFRDGIIVKTTQRGRKVEILNDSNIVFRVIFPKSKDLNVIGYGSAFAYLGEKNLLQRSYDGLLLQFHHPSFSSHSYTEMIDRFGKTERESVQLLTFPDGSTLKVTSVGLITFLHKPSQVLNEESTHERWLQLFTTPEYHSQGVYDVSLREGWVGTKDRESNQFQVQVDGPSEVKIAVSFNIGNEEEEVNNYPSGFHVPEQNYFLPPPDNCVLPRLFLVYPDGSGAEFLTEEQLAVLDDSKMTRWRQQERSFIQLSADSSEGRGYMKHSFTEEISLLNFERPNSLVQIEKRINLVPYGLPDVIFRSFEEVDWDRSFAQVNQAIQQVRQQRQAYQQDLQTLRNKVK